MTAIALQSAAPRQSSVPSPDVRHTARCAPRRRRFRRRRLSSARVSTGPVARDSRGWLQRLLALTTRPAVNCWCCERRRRVQRRFSSVLPARSGKPSAAVPQPSPSRAAAQKRCAPHAPHSCVSDVFHYCYYAENRKCVHVLLGGMVLVVGPRPNMLRTGASQLHKVPNESV